MKSSSPASPVRSMTGFARAACATASNTSFVLTLKSVNHRFLDLQFHLPNGMDALEIELRRTLKDHMARGHVEVRLSINRAAEGSAARCDPSMIRAYLEAFHAAASEHHLRGEPDLNAALRLPGVWTTESGWPPEEIAAVETEAAAAMPLLLENLNAMRTQEGRALAEELERVMDRLRSHVEELAGLRAGMQQAQTERLEQKMRELLGSSIDRDRILQEAAMVAERSDVEEELARMRAHIAHFLDLLHGGGELGKKLDFLLQEMTREANTTLSKTGGIAARSLRITELGLAMKSEIEKAREQVQNIE